MANRQLVYLHCDSVDSVERHRLSAIGVRTLFARWVMIPACASDQDPLSLNVEIPDFRGESDLKLLQSLPGVTKVGTFDADIVLPDPLQARRQHYEHMAA